MRTVPLRPSLSLWRAAVSFCCHRQHPQDHTDWPSYGPVLCNCVLTGTILPWLPPSTLATFQSWDVLLSCLSVLLSQGQMAPSTSQYHCGSLPFMFRKFIVSRHGSQHISEHTTTYSLLFPHQNGSSRDESLVYQPLTCGQDQYLRNGPELS